MKQTYILSILLCLTTLMPAGGQDLPVETVIQTGHYAAITSVAFSEDGNFAATGSADKTVKLWEVSTGKEIRSYLGHTHDIRFLAFDHQGHVLASIDRDYRLILWDIPRSRKIREFKLEDDRLLYVTFMPDDQIIITGTEKHHAIAWDIETGSEIRRYKPDTADIYMQKRFGYPTARSVEIDHAQKYLLTGSNDHTAFLFDLKTGRQLRKFKSDRTSCSGCPINAHFSPSGSEIVAGNMDSVFVWETASGEVIRKMESQRGGFGAAYYSPDGRYLASTLYGDVYVWDARTGKQLGILEGHLKDVTDLAFHPRKNILFSGSEDRTAKIWQLPQLREMMTLKGYLNDVDEKILGDGYMYWVAFMNEMKMSPDGRYMAIGKTGNNAKLLDFKSGKVLRTFRGHQGIVISLDFSPSGKLLATGGADGTVRIWEVASGKMLSSLPERTANIPCFSVDFSPDGKLLATGSWDGMVRIWEVETGQLVQRIRAHENVSPYAVQFSHNGLYVISGGLDRKLKMFEIDTGEEIREFIGHTNVVSAVRRHPDQRTMITASWDGRAKLWDLATGMQIRKFTAHQARVQSLDVDPEGKTMVTGSDDNTARLWDLTEGKLLRSFEGHQGTVSSVNLIPGGEWLMTGSHDGTLKLWDLHSGALLLTYIFIGEEDWMISNPQGYFDASEGARKSISFVQGTRIFNIDQFFDEFYRPGLLRETLEVYAENAPDDLDADPGSAEASGRPAPPPFQSGSVKDRLKSSPPPSVKILSPSSRDTIHSPSLTLSFELTNRGGGISEIRLMNNGKRILYNNEEVLLVPRKSGKSITTNTDVPLVAGRNTIQVSAYSEGRIESMPEVVQVWYDGKGRIINCYLMAVGINEYENPALNLNYAKADARAFSKAIQESGKTIFTDIRINTLFDKQATRDNILSALEEVAAKARPEDVFLFYYAGHGSMVDDQFYFIPTENVSLYQEERLEEESIRAEAIQEKFSQIPALKQVVILDACQSGGSTEILAQRGATEEKAMAQLSRSSGVHVLAAAGSEQYATEVGSLGHGLFTYTILQALAGGADGAPDDGSVTVYELKAYLNNLVPELSEQHKGSPQWPYTFSIGHDFPLVRKKSPDTEME